VSACKLPLALEVVLVVVVVVVIVVEEATITVLRVAIYCTRLCTAILEYCCTTSSNIIVTVETNEND
jgi:hypothetical protein